MKKEFVAYNIFEYNDYFSLYKDSVACNRFLLNQPENNFLYVSKSFSTNTTIENNVTGHIGIKRFFSLEQVDGIFLLLFICFIFFMQIYKNGLVVIKENMNLVFSSRKNLNLFSETTITEFWYSFILVFQTIFLAAIILYIYFFENMQVIHVTAYPLLTILFFSLVIFVWELIKILFYRFAGYIFDIQENISVWIRTYLIITIMMGLISFIPALLLIYADYYHHVLFFFFLALFLASRLIIFYRIVTFFLSKNVNFLYWIAYLCSIEIIPYVILYNGLIYVYKTDVINLLWR